MPNLQGVITMLIVAEGNVAQLMGIVVLAQIIVEQVRLLSIYGPFRSL